MMRIGEFSQLSRITIKTLRYYDEIDLLKPHEVDSSTGHRLYALNQLSQVNRILALKALGLSLDQVQDVLSDGLSDNQLMTMLTIKKSELLHTLSAIQKQIERLDTRIQYVMQEGKMPDYEVIVKSVASQRVLSIRETITDGSMIESRLHKIYDVLKTKNIESAGEWMTLYQHEGFRAKNLDVELAVPIGDLDIAKVKLDDDQMMTVRTIAGHDLVATVIERGRNETWDKSYRALSDYLQNHAYELILPTREVYITDENDRDGWLVEIQYPIKKVVNTSRE